MVGAEYAPLLTGKVQIGTVLNDQRQSLLEELRLRGADVDTKEKITATKNMLLGNECPNPTIYPNEKKCFLPKFLVATDWMTDNLTDTLAKIVDMRTERINGG